MPRTLTPRQLARRSRLPDATRLIDVRAAGGAAADPHLRRDDLARLEVGRAPYHAFHLWCRDATEARDNWPGPR